MTRLCNSLSISLSQQLRGRKEEAYPKAASREKPARAARLRSPAPLHGKKRKEKRESVMDAGKGPHAEAQARTSTAGKKDGGIKTNKSQGTEKELARPRLGPGAIPHPRNESLPSLGGHVQALFWETEAGSAPAARRGRASAGRSSQGRVLPVPAGDGRRRRCHGQGWQRPGAQAGGRTPQPRVVGSCQTQSSLTPSQTPLIPVSPSPTQAGNGRRGQI